MTAQAISSPEQLLARIVPGALDRLVAQVVQAPRLDNVQHHLYRPILGSKGYNGLTCVLSAQYGVSSRYGWVDLLLKWPGSPTGESRLFPALMRADAPVPRLEGTLPLTEPPAERTDEVMVFEFLPHIGFVEEDRLALASTLGRFHALPREQFSDLPTRCFRTQVPSWIETWERLQHHAAAGELGESIHALCKREALACSAFPSFAEAAAGRAEDLLRGVVHNDVSIQNTGWRQDRSELLLFDVPQMSIGCLALDAIQLFPEGAVDAAVAQRYLEVRRDRGGPAQSVADLLESVELIRPLQRINFYGWSVWKSIDGRVDWTDDVEEGRRVYRSWLFDSLTRTIACIQAAA